MAEHWIELLSAQSLLEALPATVAADIRYLESSGLEPLEIGDHLAAQDEGAYSARSLGRNAAAFWSHLQHELYLLVCTDDTKYASVRESLGKESTVTGAVTLSLVSTAVSTHLGIEAGLATPFVAIGLMALLHTTKEAWCAQVSTRTNSPPPNV